MKKTPSFLLLTFLLIPIFVGAQVGIGTFDPAPSSLLELFSKSKGLLVPRMTSAERDLIIAPAVGLLIYNTSTSNFNYFDIDWKDYSGFAKNYNSNLTGDITTITTSNEVVNGMSITPQFAGKYKVTFNSYYSNAPISTGPFSSEKGEIDLQSIYDNLQSLPITNGTHGVVLGNGEALIPGVYALSGATSTVGTLYFDGQGNPDALFVIRIDGAFSAGVATKMVLLNGAKASNIFWVIEGAASIEASTILKGTVITHAGAITMGAGGNLEGRLFSIVGAISVNTVKTIIPSGISVIDLGVLSTFIYYSSAGAVTNGGSSVITGNIGTNVGAISGYGSPTVFKGSFLNAGGSITTLSPNNTNALGTFGIYQNGVLIPSSNKILTSNADSVNLSLQAIATILPNQAIDVRWNTDSEKIVMGNRTLILIKVQ
ncbi:ice-binding family protein [Flavobacterium yafengii]|uniref:ice-binding family protein n=1 Tax=Flavobacterium yafengii TaxID=3041253 RepID=UPI0024A8899A|nr:ice-binding family protein [Flavobacterium yafengii]MDI5899634.1 ice-binding family protein [Flavobacterium yafengii]MDI6048156.1 ice-binding family protein [Flavobacterium yafengii]